MADQPAVLRWQEATILSVVTLTPRVKGLTLRPAKPLAFIAGQHVDVRLTAPDGYQAQRSYSIGSAPDEGEAFELDIERLEDGEVSPFFHEVAAAGDAIEFRGPIGGHFNWEAEDGGPLLLVGGGSGVVPLLSILRHRARVAPEVKAALIYSSRTLDEVIHRAELLRRDETEPQFSLHLALTRQSAPVRGHHVGRMSPALIAETLHWLGEPKLVYVCGSNSFVEAADQLLMMAGVEFGKIKTERYGGA